jgi:nucleotide-binding universal stress UspA family protein
MSEGNIYMEGDNDMKKILVPTDGSDCSDLAIDKAGELAEKFESEVVLIHVNEVPGRSIFINPVVSDATPSFFNERTDGPVKTISVPKEYLDNLEKAGQDILDRGKERLVEKGIKVSMAAVRGKPADAIIDYVEHNDIDLVVMGSHGMGGFRRFFMGSVTHKVALSIKKPIMIVR